MKNNSVLYFPSIEFHDEHWLRSAVCIWDDIRRIVPPDYTPKDSDCVKELVDAGIVRDVQLNSQDMSEAANDFSFFLKNATCDAAALTGDSGELHRLHKGKVGERLSSFFNSHHNPLSPSDEWYGVPATLCHAYMLHLANTIARRRQIGKATDNKDSFAVSPYIDSNGTLSDCGYEQDASRCHAMLALTTVIPTDIKFMPIKKLISFHNENIVGRLLFSESLERISDEVSEIRDATEVKSRVRDAIESFENAKVRIIRESSLKTQDYINAVCCMGIPTSLTALGVMATSSDIFKPFAIGQSAIIGIAATCADLYSVSKKNKSIPQSPQSYYLSLKESINSVFLSRYPNRGNDFWAVMEEFIND